MDHYYMVVEGHISEIVETESPEQVPTAVARNKYLQGQWIVRKGKADLHWIGYEFHPSGRITGRQVDIIDLGPTTAYDRPGLPPHRDTSSPCSQLRSVCPMLDGDSRTFDHTL